MSPPPNPVHCQLLKELNNLNGAEMNVDNETLHCLWISMYTVKTQQRSLSFGEAGLRSERAGFLK